MLRPNQLDRLAHRRSGGDNVVDDDDSPLERRADEHSTFTVILALLPVVAVRQIVPKFGQSDGGGRHQRNALVGRSEEPVAGETRVAERLRIKSTELPQTRAVVEQTGVEEVRTLATCLRDEFTET